MIESIDEKLKVLLAEKSQEQAEVVPKSVPTPEKAAVSKHRLTPEEKQIKAAVMDALKARIAYANDGMMSTVKASEQSHRVMAHHKVKIEDNTVTLNEEPLFAIHRHYYARKTQGCYRELMPTLEYIKREKSKEASQEKPSIRDKLKTPCRSSKTEQDKQKHKSNEMER